MDDTRDDGAVVDGGAPIAETTACPLCEGEISPNAKKCRHCGEWVARDCLVCGTPIRREWAAEGKCASCQRKLTLAATAPAPMVPRHSRSTAAVLAFLLGGIGGHKFYLGKPGQGILYLVFCWTMIPALLGLIESVVYLASSDESFAEKYG